MSDTFRSTYRELSGEEQAQLALFKANAQQLLEQLKIVASGAAGGDARCFALARTKLEECVMWAVKGATA